MPEPGLSEIVNMTVDSERGTGNPAVVIDNSQMISQLNQAAQFKAENDWRKYTSFLGNLKEVYKDLGEVSKMPLLTEDREALKEQMASIVKGIANDPHGFFGGGAKYQETLANVAKLQSDATESKQNALYDEAHRQYFYRNPELDTEENRSLLQQYRNQKLGARQPYLMKLPGLFDPKSIADEINTIVKESGKEENPTPDNQFLSTRAWTKYDPTKYRDIAENLFYQADKRGIPLVETIKKRYEQLPEELKKKYAGSKDPAKDYYLDVMDAYRMQDSENIDMAPNPGYQEKERIAAQKAIASMSAATQREGNVLDLIGKGYVPDKNEPGGWKYVGKGAPGAVVEPIKFWSNSIVPQLPSQPDTFSGDVETTSDKISGLSVGLEGEKSIEEGKGIGLYNPKKDKPVNVRVRYKNGVPQGVIIGGVYINGDDFDRKATSLQNKSMTNKGLDTPVFDASGNAVTDPNILKQLEGQ